MVITRRFRPGRLLASQILQDASGLMADELPPHWMDAMSEGMVEIAKLADMEDHLMTEEARTLAETFFTALERVDIDMLVSENPLDPNHPYVSIKGFTWNTLPEHVKQPFVLACEEVWSVLGM